MKLINLFAEKYMGKDFRAYRTKQILETIENNNDKKVLGVSKSIGRRKNRLKCKWIVLLHKDGIGREIQIFYETI